MPTYFDLQNSPVLTTPSALTAPKITSIGYPGDDTAADPAGGQTITLTGAGFEAGASVIVNGNAVGVVSVVSSTTITFTSTAQSAGSYPIYVVNTDGGTAIAVPGIQYSGTPTWTTAAGSLGSYTETVAIANTVTATGDAPITYSVFSGSLPTGATLNSANGYISGTSPAAASPTTYTFTIRATDAQQQDTNRQFSLTINPDVVTWSSPANGTTYTSVANTALANVPLSASAASGQSITYTANALPTGLSISGSNITGTPTVVANSSTLLTATAATTNATATRTINWVISVANDPFFPYVTTLLSASTPASTFVTDASTNAFAVTVNGDTRPTNFSPYTPGYYSNLFPAANNGSDNLSIPHSTALSFTASDNITVEAWINLSVHNTYSFICSKGNEGSREWALSVSSTTLGFYWSTNGSSSGDSTVTGSFSFQLGTWYHVAACKSGTSVFLFVNGTQVGTTGTFTTINNGTGPFRVATFLDYTGISHCLGGFISNLRFVKGTALYTSNFTPSTTPLTAVTNTQLLTCQSARYLDNSSNNFTITRNGSPQISSFDPFLPDSNFAGRGSGYFDGTGDYLSVPDNEAFNFTGDFTIECWVYPTVTQTTYLIGQSASTDYAPVLIYFSNGQPGIAVSSTGSTWTINGTVGTQLTLNAWSHLAAVRSGNKWSIYVNGVENVITASTAITPYNSTDPLGIGGEAAGTLNYPYTGYMTDVRIVKGTAVYTANFTPPTAPLTAIANTSLLTLQNNQPNNNNMFLDSSTNNFNITRNGNTTQGTFSPYGGGWSNFFNGSTDYFSMSDNNAFQYGASDFALECWVYPPATPATYSYIVSQWYTGDKGIIFGNVNGYPAFLYSTTGSNDLSVTSSTVFPVNQWSHLMACRTGNTISLYLNGTRVATTTESGTLYNSTSSIGIATHVQGLGSYLWSGYISNLRSIAGSNPYNAAQTTITVPTSPLTAVANTRLLICADNRFIDDGPSNFTLTRAGTPSVQRFNPFNPVLTTPTSYSGYFDGTGDYLSAASNAAFAPGTGDFTIECFVNLGSLTGAQGFFQNTNSTNSAITDKFWFGYGGGTGVILSAHNGGSGQASASWSPSIGVWYHVAVVRQSGTIKMFVDGVSLSVTGSTTFNGYSLGQAGVSIGLVTTPSYFTGYISNLRYVVGTAVYTTNFTPPTAPLTAIANTQLLTLQSPTFTDNSTNNFTITANGDTAPRQFNPFGWTSTTGSSAAYTPALYGGSGYLDGSGDYLDLGVQPNLYLNSSTYTIECWVYFTRSPGTANAGTLQAAMAQGDGAWFGSANEHNWYLLFEPSQVNFGKQPTTYTASYTPALNVWTHVAIVGNSSGTITMYINGVSLGTQTSRSALGSASWATRIGLGFYGDSKVANYFQGYITDVRITKGTARYTSNFQPPVAPLTALQNTVLLTNMTGAGIYDSSMMNNYETVGNASINTALKKYGNTSMYFDGSGDWLRTPSSPNFAFGTGDFTLEMWAYFTSVASFPTLTDSRASAASTAGFNLGLSSARVQLYTTSQLAIGATTLSANTWYHIAVCRSGSTLRIFLNGAQDASISNSTNWSDQTLIVGATPDLTNTMTGYIDDLRITRGVARYTTTFTPPTTPFITN